MNINFGQGVLNLPASLLSYIKDLSDADAKILLLLSSDPSLAGKKTALAKASGISEAAVAETLSRWEERGILSLGEPVAPTSSKKAEKPKKLRRADELPNYTSSEIADLLESREAVKSLINEAQELIGKMFNPSEINIVIGMVDYLGMSEEAILLLLAHCRNIGKTNLRAIEKYAYSLVDRGITDSKELSEEFLREELRHSFEGEIRTMFGMKSRALTSRENTMLTNWISFGYDAQIVRKAYEITVSATGDASVPYANAILETWNAAGLRTESEIDKFLAEKQSGKDAKKKNNLGNSFDTDEFFEAALKRSFAEKGGK